MYRMIYPSEISRFGISHRWVATDAGLGKYEINNFARIFANPTDSPVNSLENFLPRVKDKNDEWVSLGANMSVEVYSPVNPPEVPRTERYPEEGVPYLNKFFFVHYTYQGDEYYAIMVCNVFDAEEKVISQIEGWGISENFYTLGVEPTPDPEEGQEEPGDGGVRPPLINQTAHDGLMGLNFDLGLSSTSPATRGLKLTYMPMGSLNAYIDAYIEDRMNLLPDLPGVGDEILNALLAPATEAVMRNCYDTFLDVYKLPVAPANGTSFTVFNIGGKEVSATGAGGQYNFSQKREIDMGVLNLREIFGSYLDYSPNMKAFIWLPFCGMFEIPINAFMKGGLELKYIIDLLSGSCTAYLFGIDRTNHSTLVGSFGGDMKLPVPLAAVAANTGIIGQALRNGLNSFASSQSQPFLTTRIAQQNIARGQQAYDFMSSGQAGGINGIGTMLGTGFGAIGEVETNIQNFGKGIAGGVAKGADFIASMREAEPVLSAVIGQVGGIGGWCGWTQPYVRIVAPVRSNPQDYTHFLGRPANVRKQIRDLQTGTLNRANAPRITIPHATQQEKDAIYRILTTGFYK